MRLPKCSAESFARQTCARVPVELTAALDPIYKALASIDEQVKETDQMIERVARKYADVDVV